MPTTMNTITKQPHSVLDPELVKTIRQTKKPKHFGVRGFIVSHNTETNKFELASKPFVAFGTMKQDYVFEVSEKMYKSTGARFIFMRLDTMCDKGFYDWSLVCYNPEKCHKIEALTKVLLSEASSLGLFIYRYVYKAVSLKALNVKAFMSFLIAEQTILYNSGYGRCNPYGYMAEFYDTLAPCADPRPSPMSGWDRSRWKRYFDEFKTKPKTVVVPNMWMHKYQRVPLERSISKQEDDVNGHE